MRTLSRAVAVLLFAGVIVYAISCKHNVVKAPDPGGISPEVLKQIAAKGLSTEGVVKAKDGSGYFAEGDIFLPLATLSDTGSKRKYVFGKNEQYRTTNVVVPLTTTVTVSISGLPASYVTALDAALARYNALGMKLSFVKVTSGAMISVLDGSSSLFPWVWGSSGFPNSSGAPYSQILLNATAIGAAPSAGFLTTTIAHEMGHCIGMRHTDYADRSFSCGGSYDPEPDAGYGTIWLHGSATWPDGGSWMLACTDAFTDRPFDSYDIIALKYIYGWEPVLCNNQEWNAIVNGVCQDGALHIDDQEYDEHHNRCSSWYWYLWSNGMQSEIHFKMTPGTCDMAF